MAGDVPGMGQLRRSNSVCTRTPPCLAQFLAPQNRPFDDHRMRPVRKFTCERVKSLDCDKSLFEIR
jgi:hypothetical protein